MLKTVHIVYQHCCTLAEYKYNLGPSNFRIAWAADRQVGVMLLATPKLDLGANGVITGQNI